MKPLRVIWDIDDDPAGNVQHIAQHGLTKEDVQAVFDAPEDADTSRATSYPMVFGTLPDGRYIANPALPTLSTLPDPHWVGSDSVPSAYGHPLRPVGMFFYPFGVAFDWILVKPLYMLGGLAPEWFGMTTDDALGYQSHMPELTISKDAPRYRYE